MTSFDRAAMIGRESMVQRIASMLERGHDVDLVGRRGHGLSMTLRAVAFHLEEREWRVLRIQGVPSLRAHPLAALHAAEIGTQNEGRFGAIVAAVQALEAFASVGRAALIIDDWDDLDEVSWGVIETVKARTRLPMVLARRPNSGTRQTPSGLDGASTRSTFVVQIQALPFAAMQRMLEGRLGGPLERASASRIYIYSAGIAGLSLGILDAMLFSERIEKSCDGYWVLEETLWDELLRGTVEGFLGTLDAAERNALQVLALEGGPTIAAAERLVGREILDRLDDQGLLVAFEVHGEPSVSVSPPVVVDYFRAEAAQLVRQRALRESTLGGEEKRWAKRPKGIAVDPLYARVLSDRVEHQLRELRSRWESQRSRAAALEYVQGLTMKPGSGRKIDEILDWPFAGEDDPMAQSSLEYIRSRRRIAEGAAVDDEIARLKGVVAELQPGTVDLIALSLKLESGGSIREEDVHVRVPGLTPVVQVRATYNIRLLGEIWFGHIAHARQTLDDLLRMRSADNPYQLSSEALLLWLEGRLSDAQDRAEQALREARASYDLDRAHAARFVLLLILTFRGRYTAIPPLLDTLRATESLTSFQVQAHADAMHLGALALVRGGQVEEGAELVRRAPTIPYFSDERPGLGRALAIAQLRVTEGRREEAAESLRESALGNWGNGLRTAALVHALAALEIDPLPGDFELIRGWLTEVDSALFQLQFELAEAIAAKDPERIARIAEQMQERGEEGNALRAWNHAVQFATTAGDEELAQRCSDARQALRSGFGAEGLDGERFSRLFLELTPRESEIVSAVVEGLSNAGIASRLGVSVRTVESHLNRILRKAGVEQRGELAGFVRVAQPRRSARESEAKSA